MLKSNSSRRFAEILLRWHSTENLRTMPWKEEKDPYKIWLSEIILQQTRVEQGTQYYLRFIEKYPTIQELANAPTNEVFKLWEGLGYYSRCKNLIETAKFISSNLAGVFPGSYEEILNLKGVGPYTAAAIASFAFNAHHAVVDGNVNRVLARYFGISTPIDSTTGKAEMASVANNLLPASAPALFNQAIMDFGATVCKPRQPLCFSCIFNKNCAAFKAGTVDLLPIKEKSLVKKSRWFYHIIFQYNDLFFVHKRTASDIWQNLFEFVTIEKDGFAVVDSVLGSLEISAQTPKSFEILYVSEPVKQQLTHQTIHSVFIHIKAPVKVKGFAGEWVKMNDLRKLPFPQTIKKFLQHFM